MPCSSSQQQQHFGGFNGINIINGTSSNSLATSHLQQQQLFYASHYLGGGQQQINVGADGGGNLLNGDGTIQRDICDAPRRWILYNYLFLGPINCFLKPIICFIRSISSLFLIVSTIHLF